MVMWRRASGPSDGQRPVSTPSDHISSTRARVPALLFFPAAPWSRRKFLRTGSGGEHIFGRRKIQALCLVWIALSLAAGDLSAADLSSDFLLRRLRAPRPAPATAQL